MFDAQLKKCIIFLIIEEEIKIPFITYRQVFMYSVPFKNAIAILSCNEQRSNRNYSGIKLSVTHGTWPGIGGHASKWRPFFKWQKSQVTLLFGHKWRWSSLDNWKKSKIFFSIEILYGSAILWTITIFHFTSHQIHRQLYRNGAGWSGAGQGRAGQVVTLGGVG